MNDILNTIAQFSPPIVLLLIVTLAVVYFIKLLFEKTVSAQLDFQSKFSEHDLDQRPVSEEKLMVDRFRLVTDLSRRLEYIFHEIARIRSEKEPREGFYRGQDIPELTGIRSELDVNRVILGEDFYNLFCEKEKLAWEIANSKSENHQRRMEIDKQIRDAVERVFAQTGIRASKSLHIN